MQPLSNPFPLFTDLSGRLLDEGYVYIGVAGQDPQSNPIALYWDAALTVPAAQPLRTAAGMVLNSGTPARVYMSAASYSMRVTTKQGVQVFYQASLTNEALAAVQAELASPTGATLIGTRQGVGLPARTVQDKIGETLSVRDFGALGNGIADDTAAAQTAYNWLAANGGGTLHFPTGTYRLNLSLTSRRVHIQGVGRDMSTLVPADPAKDVVNVAYRAADWRLVHISDLGFGTWGAVVGTYPGAAIGFGGTTYTANDQYSGGAVVARCSFSGFDRFIARRQGQIGVWLEHNEFNQANFHIHSVGWPDTPPSTGIMHAGCLFSRDNHYAGAQRAVFYFDSPTVGTGQVMIENDIIENNPGMVLFIKNFSDNGDTPGFTVRGVWNEMNNTATSVTIDGVSYPTRFAYIANTAALMFEDTPLGPLELINANVITRGCDLSKLGDRTTRDANSSIRHRDARGFAGFQVHDVVDSTQGQFAGPPASNTGVWWPMLPAVARTKAHAPRVGCYYDAGGALTFTGTVTRAMTAPAGGDPVCTPFNAAFDLTINAGETLLPPLSAAPTPGKWCVVKYLYRLKSGAAPSVSFTGASGEIGAHRLDSPDWRMIVAMYQVGAGGANTLYHTGGSGTGVIAIGGFSHVTFDTRDEALAYLNASVIATT